MNADAENETVDLISIQQTKCVVNDQEMHLPQPSLGSPKFHIAHSELAQMLMQQHVPSLVGSVPILKPLMNTINNSAYEVATQFTESLGEKQGDSGQQLISMGNDQNLDIMVISTPVHSTNNFDTKSGQKKWHECEELDRRDGGGGAGYISFNVQQDNKLSPVAQHLCLVMPWKFYHQPRDSLWFKLVLQILIL
ncbi:hypothetical protein HAX54_010187 [Datura stramonium]|uniref:Uncharacterized protein n=1 Tax=Datura stramonium TaxID=4076 RepID=A0ABS8TIP6_DATST|nr:hypothetical protein [Datura stramonium]